MPYNTHPHCTERLNYELLPWFRQGGTSTKAAIFDENGQQIASAGMDTVMLIPRPGFTERDMDEMWEANCQVIRKSLKKAGLSGTDIRCVSVCGHGKGLYLWGKDGRPVRNGIISTEQPGLALSPDMGTEWHSAEGFPAFLPTYSQQSASFPAGLAQRHEPETLENTRWIFACKDYIRYRLTGEAFAERTDYSGCNLLNLYTGEYDRDLLALFGLSDCADKLPRFAIPRISAAISQKQPQKIPVLPQAHPVARREPLTSMPARWA